ncbi:glycolytic proteins transcriptional activator gcr1 [Thoreauomyces humboldtii]|nr:glycolytic proteins transcriptional activator gcr1 [Thoreauomyces humboldtii]
MLSQSNLSTIQDAIHISSVLSLLGSLSIIVSYTITTRRHDSLANRLILYMSCADAVAAIAQMIGSAWFGEDDRSACKAQGFFITSMLLSSMLWTLSMSSSILFAVFWARPLVFLERYEKYFHVVAWGLPVIIATGLVFAQEGDIYGPSVLWCFIKSTHSWERMVFFYGPLWCIFFLNLIAYASAGWRVFRTRQQLLKEASESRPPTFTETGLPAMHDYIVKTSFYLVVYFIIWLFPTINRAQTLANPANPVFTLYLLHAIFSPISGFLNALVYFWGSADHRRRSSMAFANRFGRRPHPDLTKSDLDCAPSSPALKPQMQMTRKARQSRGVSLRPSTTPFAQPSEDGGSDSEDRMGKEAASVDGTVRHGSWADGDDHGFVGTPMQQA